MRSNSKTFFAVLTVSLCLLFATSNAMGIETVDEKLDRVMEKLQRLEKVESELKVLKKKMARLEIGEPVTEEENLLRKKVEIWLEKKYEDMAYDTEFKRNLLGFDLELEGGLTFIYQGIIGGTHSVFDDRDGARRDALTFSFGIGLTAHLTENSFVYILFEGGNGDGIDAAIPNNIGLNDDTEPTADPLDPTNGGSASDVRVTEAYYEGSFFQGKVVLSVGKLNLSNYFDGNAVANDECEQFISTALVNNLSIPFPDDNDAAIRLLYSPFGPYDPDDENENATDWLLFQFALSETDADFNEVTHDGLMMFEVEFRPHKAPCMKQFFNGRPGHYRFGFYSSSADFYSLGERRRGADSATPADRGSVGFYMSFDQNIADWLTLFMRYGNQDSDIAENNQFWSAGGEIPGYLWGREDDALAFGMGVNVNNSDSGFLWPQCQGDERIWEVYYRWRVNRHIAISPVMQVLQNPAGERSRTTTATILGIRLQIDF